MNYGKYVRIDKIKDIIDLQVKGLPSTYYTDIPLDDMIKQINGLPTLDIDSLIQALDDTKEEYKKLMFKETQAMWINILIGRQNGLETAKQMILEELNL